MRLPEIRYPLFWLVGLVLVGVAGWSIWPVTRPVRSALADGWRRVVEGPPVPASSEPQEFLASIPRRVLVLRTNLPVTDVPDGRVVETIGRRIFADLYDTWPLDPVDEPTHYRIGNLRPFGWVEAAAVLPWDTRLAVRLAGSKLPIAETPGGPTRTVELEPESILPILDWSGDAVKLGLWRSDAAWERRSGHGWVNKEALAEDTLGVLMSRGELLMHVRGLLDRADSSTRERLRLDAILGDRLRGEATSDARRVAISRGLPDWSVRRPSDGGASALERLSHQNETWRAELSWSGFAFRVISLDELP